MIADTSRQRRLPVPARLCRAVTLTLLTFCCLGQASCSYLDRARRISDVAVEASQQLALQTVIEANVERQRLRRLRCVDPLLTPATISLGASDPRLGKPWVEELLDDCPAFSAFLLDTALTRLALHGLSPGVANVPAHD
jgi:hypothetical protein